MAPEARQITQSEWALSSPNKRMQNVSDKILTGLYISECPDNFSLIAYTYSIGVVRVSEVILDLLVTAKDPFLRLLGPRRLLLCRGRLRRGRIGYRLLGGVALGSLISQG